MAKIVIQNWKELEQFVERIRESGLSERPTIGKVEIDLPDKLLKTLLFGLPKGKEKEMTVRHPTEEILSYMRKKAGIISTKELQKELNLFAKQVNAAVFQLNKAGKLERVQKGKYQLSKKS